MKRPTILLAEDERDLALIIRDTLATLDFRVIIAADGEEALRLYREQCPDIVVTDIMMPRMDGFELVRRLRSTDKRTPILFLTARTDTDDVVSGFKMGANDYLRKPFSMRELIVRIEAIHNRASDDATTASSSSQPTPIPIANSPSSPASSATSSFATAPNPRTPTQLCVASFTLDPENYRLLRADEAPISLTPRETEILRRLFLHPNRVVASRPILLDLWGHDTPYNARSLHVFISKLRSKLAADPHLHISNVHGVGYRLEVITP